MSALNCHGRPGVADIAQRAHELLDVMQSHFRLDDRQRALVAELKSRLPMSGGVAKTRPRAAPPRARNERRTARA